MERVLEQAVQDANQNQYASFGQRLGAALLDTVATFIIFFPVFFVLGVVGGIFNILSKTELSVFNGVSQLICLLVGLVMYWLFYAGFESSPLQGTPGKWLLGLKVQNNAGETLTFSSASIRLCIRLIYNVPQYVIEFISILAILTNLQLVSSDSLSLFRNIGWIITLILYSAGCLMALRTSKVQAFHDWLSGVVVVKKAKTGHATRSDAVSDEKHSNLFS